MLNVEFSLTMYFGEVHYYIAQEGEIIIYGFFRVKASIVDWLPGQMYAPTSFPLWG